MCLHFFLQADATDLCALEHLGIKAVFPMPSPAETANTEIITCNSLHIASLSSTM